MNSPITSKLEQIGQRVVRWRAELVVTWSLAVIIGAVCVLGLVDFWLRLGRADRFITWFILVALAGFVVWRVGRALHRRFTPEGVAAMVEEEFPQLDNHLINYLQFSKDTGKDPFKKAYVHRGAPEWQALDFREMRNREAHRRSRITLLASVVVLLLPALFIGNAWGVALWRTVNPFSSVPPVTLTRIVEVRPGVTTVPQGDPIVLACTVQGFRGHEVKVDVDPGDADPTTYALGRITRDEHQDFSHRIAKVSTTLRYRIRAGDAPDSEWFTVDTRPPAAFTRIRLEVAPPEYTGRSAQSLDPRSEPVDIPVGSTVTATAISNTSLESVNLETAGAEPIVMTAAAAGATNWKAVTTVETGGSLRIAAVDIYGDKLEETIAYALLPDRAPVIEILSPGARTILPPGELPRINFHISDDYGLGQLIIEEVQPGVSSDRPGIVLRKWPGVGQRDVEESWTHEGPPLRGRDIAFRIVARDERPGTPHESRSPTVVFTLPTLAEVSQQRSKLEQQAVAGLHQVIELQKQNITETDSYRMTVAATTEEQWKTVADRQQQIRDLTRQLLSDALKPLGALTPKVKALYVNEMAGAVDSLRAIPAVEPVHKRRHAAEALALEKTILARLTRAEASFSQSQADRQLAGISKLLEALIRGQNTALEQTRAVAEHKTKVSTVLVDVQDALAEDLTAFVNACRSEAEAVRGNDGAFASTLDQIAMQAEQLGIRQDMVLAAERLDEDKPSEAVPLEERALGNLKALRMMIEQVRLEREGVKREVLLEAVQQAKEKLAKIKAEFEKELAAMDAIRGASDKNDEEFDAMEEELEELIRKTNEELLKIPTDLHVFTDLNVANDLVEDVFSIFQEVEQAEGTGEDEQREMSDLGFAKEDVQLEMMEEAEGRLDDVEMWLGDDPDFEKVTTEAFDREEMPESGIATGALATEVEDMIGDLLDEDEDMEEEANDGATTHALPDMAMGWEVKEGDISSYAAKGKSGNETPDHHEQDGRSNVGRQGMSTGETAAGSGTISEGDKNIEERRTEDPTQSGQIDLDGEADTKATGGGKLGTGKADEKGMSGGVERMDSNEEGSNEGMAALMARQADAVFAKASLKNVRVDDLKRAAHHLRQSADAEAKGDIQQLREQRKLAVSSLKKAKAHLEQGPSGAMEVGGSAGVLDDVIESGPDHAPPQYRDQVSDYYKALNDAM
jgi:hypothetical protein